MKQIFITLLIDDEETFEAYKDSDPDIIMSDLQHGTLTEKCSMVDVVVESELDLLARSVSIDGATIPQGIVAVFIGKDDRVVATATDFGRSHPGGFSLREAQKIRAKDRLSLKVIEALASPMLSNSIDSYSAKQIVDKMCRDGCRVLFAKVGADEC